MAWATGRAGGAEAAGVGGAGEVEEGLEELAEGWVGAAVRAGVRGLEAAAGEMAASAEGAAEDCKQRQGAQAAR